MSLNTRVYSWTSFLPAICINLLHVSLIVRGVEWIQSTGTYGPLGFGVGSYMSQGSTVVWNEWYSRNECLNISKHVLRTFTWNINEYHKIAYNCLLSTVTLPSKKRCFMLFPDPKDMSCRHRWDGWKAACAFKRWMPNQKFKQRCGPKWSKHRTATSANWHSLIQASGPGATPFLNPSAYHAQGLMAVVVSV